MSNPTPTIRTIAPRSAVVALVLLLAGAACSATSDDVDAGAGGSPAASPPVSLVGNVSDHGEQQVSGAAPELKLELDDSYFAPTYVHAEPGAVVKVELENEGSKVHTFTIDDETIDVKVDPGASATVDVTMPASGSLHYFCQIHSGAGMQGSFVVESAAAPTTASTTKPTTPPTSSSYGGY
jgi:plastocyanin